jgi:hypothetical protein
MRESGYYWVTCSILGCIHNDHDKPQVAYYNSEDTDQPWMLIYDENTYNERDFRVIEKVSSPPIEGRQRVTLASPIG